MSHLDQDDWENDPVWNLVDEAKPSKAGPFFVRNVMREVRLAEGKPARWWRGLLSPKPILAGALGVAAAITIIASLGPEQPEAPGIGQTEPTVPSPLDELVAEEMLLEAAEDPSAFSDEALMALLTD
ncbi:MAG: hypothetical protein GWO24_22495 [Akkermansiaceae bacterium]|nr:hypothetical protein [Akkermansiaceae bacterium]